MGKEWERKEQAAVKKVSSCSYTYGGFTLLRNEPMAVQSIAMQITGLQLTFPLLTRLLDAGGGCGGHGLSDIAEAVSCGSGRRSRGQCPRS